MTHSKSNAFQNQQCLYPNARILVIDDEAANVLMLEHLLQEWGYLAVRGITNPLQTLDVYNEFHPDLVLLDLMMPELDGFTVMENLRGAAQLQMQLSIVVLTADITVETKRKALGLGAQDFLTKPFDIVELALRLNHLLENQFLHRQLHQQNGILEDRVAERTAQLAKSERETALCLGIAGEYRDDDTGHHTQRVGTTAAILARHSGLSEQHTELMFQAAPLHDVGKIGIPDSILLKPGRLTVEEFEAMKRHCQIGHAILSRHNTPLLQLASSIALTHHERWDGTGYPQKLSGEGIPLEGRIVAIADVFDALTHERPYKDAWPIGEAVAEIESQGGRQFDPALVEIFSRHLHSILEVFEGSRK